MIQHGTMIIEILPVGPFQCNCTILGCEQTREALIVDPGDEPQRILARVQELNLLPRYLLHTHAHLDHIGGTRLVREALSTPILIHKGDQWLYENLPMQGALFGLLQGKPLPIDQFVEDEQEITFGQYKAGVIHTPGHTPGSICLRIEAGDGALVLTGDTLFAQSIGRTDLWGGSYDQILTSIKQRLLRLDDDTGVLPGHGPATSIGVEKRVNPFLL